MHICEPVFGDIAHQPGAVIPSSIAVTIQPRGFAVQRVPASGSDNAHISVTPGNIRTGIHVAVSPAKLNVTGSIEGGSDASQSGNAGPLRRRSTRILRHECRKRKQAQANREDKDRFYSHAKPQVSVSRLRIRIARLPFAD